MTHLSMRTIRQRLVAAGIRLEGDETDDEIMEAWRNLVSRSDR